MKYILFLFLIIVCSGSVISASVNFDCPSTVQSDEDFECNLRVSEIEGIYDIKVDLSVDGKTVGKVWNGETWKSCFYYLKNFIGNDEERKIKLKIVNYSGNIFGVLKLRQGNKREFLDFDLSVGDVIPDNIAPKEESEEKIETNISKNISKATKVVMPNVPVKIIKLNNFTEGKEDEKWETVYESKNELIKKYYVYGFSLFLIFIIIVLLIKN